MSETDLVADLKASLQDAATVFFAGPDADFKRHLAVAALDFARIRPRTLVGSLTLVADQSEYAELPADFYLFKSSLWGVSPAPAARPWDTNWHGRLPDVFQVETGGVAGLSVRPAPTAAQIAALGATFRYYYAARHAIHESDGAQTTIRAGDRGLLILRAQAEAMRELTFRNIFKPVQVLQGMSSTPRNGTPAALFRALIEEFEAAA
ncbi:MAG: hypothetical protein AB7P08_17280 [Burkholderiales bacterium]